MPNAKGFTKGLMTDAKGFTKGLMDVANVCESGESVDTTSLCSDFTAASGAYRGIFRPVGLHSTIICFTKLLARFGS